MNLFVKQKLTHRLGERIFGYQGKDRGRDISGICDWQIPFWDIAFTSFGLRSEITGLHGSCFFPFFLINCCTLFHSGCTILYSFNGVYPHPWQNLLFCILFILFCWIIAILVPNRKRSTSRLYIVTLLIQLICRVHHEKHWAGRNTSWNQDCWEKYQ